MSLSSFKHSDKREGSPLTTPTKNRSTSSTSSSSSTLKSHTAFRFTLWTSLWISLFYTFLDSILPPLLSPLYGLVLSSTSELHRTSLGCFVAGYASISFSSLWTTLSSKKKKNASLSHTNKNKKTKQDDLTPSFFLMSYAMKKIQLVCLLLLLTPWSLDLIATFCAFLSQLTFLPSFLGTLFFSSPSIQEWVRSPVWHPYLIHGLVGLFFMAFLLGQSLASFLWCYRSWNFPFLAWIPWLVLVPIYFSGSTFVPWVLSWIGHSIFHWVTLDSVFLHSFLIPFTCIFSIGLSGMYFFYVKSSRSWKSSLGWLAWMGLICSLTWYGFHTSRHLQPVLNVQPIPLPSNYMLLEKIGTHQVLLEPKRNILFLRAHHSIIGGIYRHTNDSIFSVFYYHDMHRLLHPFTSQLQVLMLGYGVGTAAETFVHHHHVVTAVELEPAVVQLNRYFPFWVTPFIQDGAFFVLQASNESYDVIVHDVFTGGQLPPTLFSFHHFQQLHRILKINGTLSVNYVGQAHDPAFRYVHQLLLFFFPHVRCFSESNQFTFTNHVFFAMKKENYHHPSLWNQMNSNVHSNPIGFQFRPLSEKDFLGSEIRWFALSRFLQHELDLPFPFASDFSSNSSLDASTLKEKQKRVLETFKTKIPNQKASIPMAVEHWKIMRELIPLEVWKEY